MLCSWATLASRAGPCALAFHATGRPSGVSALSTAVYAPALMIVPYRLQSNRSYWAGSEKSNVSMSLNSKPSRPCSST